MQDRHLAWMVGWMDGVDGGVVAALAQEPSDRRQWAPLVSASPSGKSCDYFACHKYSQAMLYYNIIFKTSSSNFQCPANAIAYPKLSAENPLASLNSRP